MSIRTLRNTLAAILGLTLGAVAAARGQTLGPPVAVRTDSTVSGYASVIWPAVYDSSRAKVTTCAQVKVAGVVKKEVCRTKTGPWVRHVVAPPPPAPPPPPPVALKAVISPKPPLCSGFTCYLNSTLSTGPVGTRREWFEICLQCNRNVAQSTDTIWVYANIPSTGTRTRGLRLIAPDGSISLDSVTFAAPGTVTPPPPPPPPDTTTPPPPPPPPPPGAAPILPEAPRLLVDVTYPTTGAVINVPAGGSLQAALNAAACGDEIVLAAGASFTGNFILPAKGCSSYIVIRGAGPCPAAGTRVTPATAAGMPVLLSPGTNLSPIEAAPGAGYYRLVCLELTAPASVASLNTLVRISPPITMTSLAQLPHHIVLDRLYIHGHATMALRRCVMGNGAHIAVIDSWLTECHENGADAQAFVAWNGPGPFHLENNYLAGSGENVMFGGADVSDAFDFIPSDIVMRRNHVHKPPAWKALWYTSKNLLEFKSAQRVLVEGNVFENNWPGGQSGHGFNWKTTVSNVPDTAVTTDINFQYNLIWKSACGIKISSGAAEASAGHTARIRIAHNMWADINQTYTGCGTLYQPQYDVRDLTIEYNTGWSTNALITMYGLPPLVRFVFRGNIGQPGAFGVKGDATSEGIPSLDKFAPGWVFSGNVLIGAVSSRYPAGNSFPASLSAAGLVSADGKLFGLSATSAYLTAGPGGSRPGVDLVRLQQHIAGVAP